jgi:hypothetical protein
LNKCIIKRKNGGEPCLVNHPVGVGRYTTDIVGHCYSNNSKSTPVHCAARDLQQTHRPQRKRKSTDDSYRTAQFYEIILYTLQLMIRDGDRFVCI